MNDAFSQWLQQQGQSNPLQNWLNPQQTQAPAPQQPAPQQQPNGAMLANLLRGAFRLDNPQNPFGQFASPFLDVLSQINFGGKGRTPEGRAEIKARIDAGKAANPGRAAVGLRPGSKLAELFSGFGGMNGNGS